ncbi:hypothetical protein pb186bvf_014825 [Paramecium bursaria]
MVTYAQSFRNAKQIYQQLYQKKYQRIYRKILSEFQSLLVPISTGTSRLASTKPYALIQGEYGKDFEAHLGRLISSPDHLKCNGIGAMIFFKMNSRGIKIRTHIIVNTLKDIYYVFIGGDSKNKKGIRKRRGEENVKKLTFKKPRRPFEDNIEIKGFGVIGNPRIFRKIKKKYGKILPLRAVFANKSGQILRSK